MNKKFDDEIKLVHPKNTFLMIEFTFLAFNIFLGGGRWVRRQINMNFQKKVQ